MELRNRLQNRMSIKCVIKIIKSMDEEAGEMTSAGGTTTTHGELNSIVASSDTKIDYTASESGESATWNAWPPGARCELNFTVAAASVHSGGITKMRHRCRQNQDVDYLHHRTGKHENTRLGGYFGESPSHITHNA